MKREEKTGRCRKKVESDEFEKGQLAHIKQSFIFLIDHFEIPIPVPVLVTPYMSFNILSLYLCPSVCWSLSIFHSVHLSFCPSVQLCVCLIVHLFAWPCICWAVWPFVCLSIFSYVYLNYMLLCSNFPVFICHSIHLSFRSSVCIPGLAMSLFPPYPCAPVS